MMQRRLRFDARSCWLLVGGMAVLHTCQHASFACADRPQDKHHALARDLELAKKCKRDCGKKFEEGGHCQIIKHPTDSHLAELQKKAKAIHEECGEEHCLQQIVEYCQQHDGDSPQPEPHSDQPAARHHHKKHNHTQASQKEWMKIGTKKDCGDEARLLQGKDTTLTQCQQLAQDTLACGPPGSDFQIVSDSKNICKCVDHGKTCDMKWDWGSGKQVWELRMPCRAFTEEKKCPTQQRFDNTGRDGYCNWEDDHCQNQKMFRTCDNGDKVKKMKDDKDFGGMFWKTCSTPHREDEGAKCPGMKARYCSEKDTASHCCCSPAGVIGEGKESTVKDCSGSYDPDEERKREEEKRRKRDGDDDDDDADGGEGDFQKRAKNGARRGASDVALGLFAVACAAYAVRRE